MPEAYSTERYRLLVEGARVAISQRTAANLAVGDKFNQAMKLVDETWEVIDTARRDGRTPHPEDVAFADRSCRNGSGMKHILAKDIGMTPDTLTTYGRICQKFPSGEEVRTYLLEKGMSFHYLRALCPRTEEDAIALLHRFYEESIPVVEAQLIAGTRDVMFRAAGRSCDYCSTPIDKTTRIELTVGRQAKRCYCGQDHLIKAVLEGQSIPHIATVMREIQQMSPGLAIDV
jgi:hypothetical protein